MPVSHIEHWVFDLDNTLYPPEARLFDEIEERMEAFMMRELAIDRASAKSLRAEFWQLHGTTLAGLMSEHDVDPHAFLDDVHRIDLSPIEHNARLADQIKGLGGQKVIYTNGSRAHGENVSQALGIRHAFENILASKTRRLSQSRAKQPLIGYLPPPALCPRKLLCLRMTRATWRFRTRWG